MSGRCSEGVWRVSGGSLEGVWRVSGGCLEVVRLFIVTVPPYIVVTYSIGK